MTERVISNEPDGAPRIATLDILRGIAILGILFMNINDMGASFSYPDVRHLGWSTADQIAWWARQILADGTARCLLQMLFGAGMVILTERIAGGEERSTVLKRYYWRNLVLVAFGLVHMFVLLWPGDILHTYGIAALIVFLFRELRPRLLIAIGLIGALSQVFGAGQAYIEQQQIRNMGVAAVEKREAGHALTSSDRQAITAERLRKARIGKNKVQNVQTVAAEDRQRAGSTAGWIAAALNKSVERLGIGELFAIWESAGVMLVGAGLFKLGILPGDRRPKFYAWLALVGYLAGGGYRALGAYQITRFDDLPHWRWTFDEFARIAITLGHLGLICLLLGTVVGAKLLKPFAAAGRTALTIYIMQSIICLWILFPPFALALYGQLSWMPLMLVSVVINAILLLSSIIYLQRYRIAPVEWAWRSIVEGRRLPFRC